MLDYSREFIELAIFENVTAAAKRLHLSTSTLSRHIAELEQQLGFKLFDRNPLKLTAAGQFYLESISSIIETLDETVRQGRSIAQEKLETFTIYMIESRSNWGNIVYEAVSTLRKLHPNIDVAIQVADRHLTTEEALENGSADVAVVFEGSVDPDAKLNLQPLLSARLCAWVNANSPLADRTSVSLEDFQGLALPVSTNRQSRTGSRSILELFHVNGVKLATHFRSINERAGFYQLRDDEVMVDGADDDEPLRFNPDLRKLEFAEPVFLQVYLATRRGDDNLLTNDFIAACKEIARTSAC